MANSVFFNAAADRLLRTTGLPGYRTPFTFMAYYKPLLDAGVLETFFTLLHDDVSEYIFAGTLSDDPFFEASASSSGTYGSTLVAGTWYHFAFASNGNAVDIYINGVFSTSVSVAGVSAITPQRMELGGWRTTNGNRYSGYIAAAKAWQRQLTAPQIVAEMGVDAPVGVTNIYGVWPFNTSKVQDFSGNGNDWTELGTVDLINDVPPISYTLGISSPLIITPEAEESMANLIPREYTLTITNGAYSAGDAVGQQISVQSPFNILSRKGYLKGFTLLDKGSQEANLDLFLFKRPITPIADNAAFVIPDNEIDRVIAALSILSSEYIQITTTTSLVSKMNLNVPIIIPRGYNFAFQLRTTGTPTYTSTSDLIVKMYFELTN